MTRTIAEAVAERRRQREKGEGVWGDYHERTMEEAIEQNRLRRLRRKIPDNPHGGGKPVMLTFEGKTQNLSAWGKEMGIKVQAISYRLKKGYPIELVLRAGKVSRGEHPGSAKAERQAAVELAYEALCSLTELQQRPMTTREIAAMIESNKALWARKGLNYHLAIMALMKHPNPHVLSTALAWVLRKVSCLPNKPMTVVKAVDGRWWMTTVGQILNK